ncbi:unnamed protein product [Brassica napus]|uniref:(rape) hypothetical protein n=1 Tax=Brassica napus TaxID=3708 RepID=A0A816UDD7_BRANA|nr:unnamed protein product [Brassica napus]
MLQPKSNRGEEQHPDFKWGDKKAVGRTDKSVSFYESFTFEDIEYRLFDCAYFQIHGQCETSIGKLIRMYETSSGEKKVKVLWFFRPMDIRSYLRDYVPQWDELFLACGDDPGVYNINDVDTILGKCSVVCLSDDRRNPLPTRRELRDARYVFSRTFDTKRKIISADFADAIAGIRVEKFFNQRIDTDPLKRPNSSADPVKSFRSESRLEKNYDRDGKLTCRTSPVKKEMSADRVHVKKYPPVNTDITSRGLKTKTAPLGSPLRSGSSGDHKPAKRRKLVLNTPDSDCFPEPGEKKVTKNPPLVDKAPSQTSVIADITSRGLKTKTTPLGSPLGSVSSGDHKPSKTRKLVLNTPDSDCFPEPGEKKLTKNPPIVDKAPSQTIGRSSWYKRLNFEEELKRAIETERLVLFENLEPSYTSIEVENLCRQALKERVDAKMIPASLVSNPHIGRALVIFYTKKAADNAISRLTRECLMLDDQRPLVGSRDFPKEVGECGSFTGHQRLVDRALMSISKRNAVSTAHCTQPNHIVHELAVEWKALHQGRLKTRGKQNKRRKLTSSSQEKLLKTSEDRSKMQVHCGINLILSPALMLISELGHRALVADVAAASPRRSIATTTARPVHFHRADSPASSSSSVIPRCFSSESGVETIAKKKVEDVMPIATGHEKEELEAELEGRRLLDIDFPEGPFGTKEAPAIVKSYYDKRIVGCPGGEGEDEHDVVWFWLEKGKSFECPVCTQYFEFWHMRNLASSSSSVIPRCFSSESVETIAKKKVEDVMPIAIGHEKEELEAQLEGRRLLDIDFPEGPFGTKEAPATVKSYYDKRIVGCPGGEGKDEHDVVWFWLEKGKSFECSVCTQYFELEVVGPGGPPDGHGDEDDEHHH